MWTWTSTEAMKGSRGRKASWFSVFFILLLVTSLWIKRTDLRPNEVMEASLDEVEDASEMHNQKQLLEDLPRVVEKYWMKKITKKG